MLGVGLLGVVFGAIAAWSGWNDINPVQVIDSVISRQPLPDHKPHAGFDRVAGFLGALLALKVAGSVAGKLPIVGGGGGETPVETPPVEIIP